MGKRSNFEHRKNDFYPTPLDAVKPLLPFLPSEFTFAEPCAGDGRLCRHIDSLTDSNAIATLVSDIEPKDQSIEKYDALTVDIPANTEYIITNPPWSRWILHPLIDRFASIRPTWLLFDADWMHTKQAIPYLQYCSKIVAIGRVKWIEDSKFTGKDNACWYLFDKNEMSGTQFYGRGFSSGR